MTRSYSGVFGAEMSPIAIASIPTTSPMKPLHFQRRPGDAGWFHGHYGASKEPLRVLAFLGGFPRRVKGVPGVDWWGLNLDIKQGGHTIEYRDEDPHIRKMFQEQLAKEGADFNIPEEVYR